MKIKAYIFPIITVLLLFVSACGEESEETDKPKPDKNNVETRKGSKNPNLETTIGEYRFGVPSPIQMAKIIKGSEATYDEQILNKSENAAEYNNEYQQALNLGVYLADLGYLIMYNKSDNAMNYLAAVNSLMTDLSLNGAFDQKLMDKFASAMDNMSSKDSMESIVSESYMAANTYLQQEKDFYKIGLILTGGIVESMHLATNVLKETNNQEVANTLGSQKSSLNNLVKLLKSVNSEKKNDLLSDLIEDLRKLQNVFHKVTLEYTYERPVTKENQKLTIITSQSNTIITDEQVEEISAIVTDIREDIIN